ncbi:MAG TPA: MarR family transcriptional regulator [Gemmatimonadaceae bacterium]|nr:MarR family transcriptional regulator [Gemmatimonadaceae bacterium]
MRSHLNQQATAIAQDQSVEFASHAMDSLRRIVRALRAAHASANAPIRDNYRVSTAQLFVLRQIAAQPGLSLAQLARHTLSSASSASEVVARLIQQGLVVRSVAPEDHRRASFVLTSAGHAAVDGAPSTAQERLVNGFATLDLRTQRALSASLERWVAAAGYGDTDAPMLMEPMDEEESELTAAVAGK